MNLGNVSVSAVGGWEDLSIRCLEGCDKELKGGDLDVSFCRKFTLTVLGCVFRMGHCNALLFLQSCRSASRQHFVFIFSTEKKEKGSDHWGLLYCLTLEDDDSVGSHPVSKANRLCVVFRPVNCHLPAVRFILRSFAQYRFLIKLRSMMVNKNVV